MNTKLIDKSKTIAFTGHCSNRITASKEEVCTLLQTTIKYSIPMDILVLWQIL